MSGDWMTFQDTASAEIRLPDWCVVDEESTVVRPAPFTAGGLLLARTAEAEARERMEAERVARQKANLSESLQEKKPDPELLRQLDILSKAIASAVAAENGRLAEMAETVVELGLAVAEKLAGDAIKDEPERVLKIVEQAIGLVDGRSACRVLLSPELLELFREGEFLEELESNPLIELVPDPSVGEFGCIVETENQKVDGRLDSRLERLRQMIRNTEGLER